MQSTFKTVAQVIRFPNKDTFIVQSKYSPTGPVFTDDNHGMGYSEDEAIDLANLIISEGSPTP